jgi:hypothetical protein
VKGEQTRAGEAAEAGAGVDVGAEEGFVGVDVAESARMAWLSRAGLMAPERRARVETKSEGEWRGRRGRGWGEFVLAEADDGAELTDVVEDDAGAGGVDDGAGMG